MQMSKLIRGVNTAICELGRLYKWAENVCARTRAPSLLCSLAQCVGLYECMCSHTHCAASTLLQQTISFYPYVCDVQLCSSACAVHNYGILIGCSF